MKIPASDLLPPVLVAMALAVAVSVFISETRAFRNAVSEWAARDLDSRTALAAAHSSGIRLRTLSSEVTHREITLWLSPTARARRPFRLSAEP